MIVFDAFKIVKVGFKTLLWGLTQPAIVIISIWGAVAACQTYLWSKLSDYVDFFVNDQWGVPVNGIFFWIFGEDGVGRIIGYCTALDVIFSFSMYIPTVIFNIAYWTLSIAIDCIIAVIVYRFSSRWAYTLKGILD